jgi:hypothetical protein
MHRFSHFSPTNLVYQSDNEDIFSLGSSLASPYSTNNNACKLPLLYSFAPEPEASRASMSSETTALSTLQQPKRGRPPKKIPPTSSDVPNHRRLGRPPGSGPKQRAKAELLANG